MNRPTPCPCHPRGDLFRSFAVGCTGCVLVYVGEGALTHGTWRHWATATIAALAFGVVCLAAWDDRQDRIVAASRERGRKHGSGQT